MFLSEKKAFTLIELLVIMVIIGFLVALTVVNLNSARIKSRDVRRISDVKQIQTALEMYLSNEGGYPQYVTPNTALVGLVSGRTYLIRVPSNPNPVTDGNCTAGTDYNYNRIESGSGYLISYCLGNDISEVVAGNRCAIPYNINASPGAVGFFSGNIGADPQPECSSCICGDCRTLNCDNLAELQSSTSSCQIADITYRAIKAGSYCLLDKAVNLGVMINGTVSMTTDSTIEKYCYNNNEANCTSDGALYSWAEAMYLPSACNSSLSGVCAAAKVYTGSLASAKRQGICPKGWHIPSDREMWQFENYLDSSLSADASNYYADQSGTNGVGAPRGTDITTHLRSDFGFVLAGNNNGGSFLMRGSAGYFWVSSQYNSGSAWMRQLTSGSGVNYRSGASKGSNSFSVRCFKD